MKSDGGRASSNRVSDTPGLFPYEKPIVKRYRLPENHIKEYQGGTGAVNSKLCVNPDNCGGAGSFGMPEMPSWLLP